MDYPTYEEPEKVMVGMKLIGLVYYDGPKREWCGYHYDTDHGFMGCETREMAIDCVKEEEGLI